LGPNFATLEIEFQLLERFSHFFEIFVKISAKSAKYKKTVIRMSLKILHPQFTFLRGTF